VFGIDREAAPLIGTTSYRGGGTAMHIPVKTIKANKNHGPTVRLRSWNCRLASFGAMIIFGFSGGVGLVFLTPLVRPLLCNTPRGHGCPTVERFSRWPACRQWFVCRLDVVFQSAVSWW
jgi:hypothetical protein